MNYTPLQLPVKVKTELNYTPLQFPLKLQKNSPGLVPFVAFSILFFIAATITGVLLYTTSSYSARHEENQKYTIARTNNIAATIAVRAELGPYAPTITDKPNYNAKIQPSGAVAGVATGSAVFTPDYSVSFDTCFDSAAVNPGTDVKLLSVRCPLYLPKGTSQGDLSFMEDGNSVSLIKADSVLFSMKKISPEGQAAPVCTTVKNYITGNGAATKECTMVKISQNPKEVKINGSTAASSMVMNMKCTGETEDTCSESSASIVVPIDGGISLILPYDEENTDPIELERVK